MWWLILPNLHMWRCKNFPDSLSEPLQRLCCRSNATAAAADVAAAAAPAAENSEEGKSRAMRGKRRKRAMTNLVHDPLARALCRGGRNFPSSFLIDVCCMKSTLECFVTGTQSESSLCWLIKNEMYSALTPLSCFTWKIRITWRKKLLFCCSG